MASNTDLEKLISNFKEIEKVEQELQKTANNLSKANKTLEATNDLLNKTYAKAKKEGRELNAEEKANVKQLEKQNASALKLVSTLTSKERVLKREQATLRLNNIEINKSVQGNNKLNKEVLNAANAHRKNISAIRGETEELSKYQMALNKVQTSMNKMAKSAGKGMKGLGKSVVSGAAAGTAAGLTSAGLSAVGVPNLLELVGLIGTSKESPEEMMKNFGLTNKGDMSYKMLNGLITMVQGLTKWGDKLKSKLGPTAKSPFGEEFGAQFGAQFGSGDISEKTITEIDTEIDKAKDNINTIRDNVDKSFKGAAKSLKTTFGDVSVISYDLKLSADGNTPVLSETHRTIGSDEELNQWAEQQQEVLDNYKILLDNLETKRQDIVDRHLIKVKSFNDKEEKELSDQKESFTPRDEPIIVEKNKKQSFGDITSEDIATQYQLAQNLINQKRKDDLDLLELNKTYNKLSREEYESQKQAIESTFESETKNLVNYVNNQLKILKGDIAELKKQGSDTRDAKREEDLGHFTEKLGTLESKFLDVQTFGDWGKQDITEITGFIDQLTKAADDDPLSDFSQSITYVLIPALESLLVKFGKLGVGLKKAEDSLKPDPSFMRHRDVKTFKDIGKGITNDFKESTNKLTPEEKKKRLEEGKDVYWTADKSAEIFSGTMDVMSTFTEAYLSQSEQRLAQLEKEGKRNTKEYALEETRYKKRAKNNINISTASAIASSWASYMKVPGGLPGAALAAAQSAALIVMGETQKRNVDSGSLDSSETSGPTGMSALELLESSQTISSLQQQTQAQSQMVLVVTDVTAQQNYQSKVKAKSSI